jgi:anti-sigma B factor antagonist
VSLALQNRRVGEIVVVSCSGRLVEGQEAKALQQHLEALLPDDPHIVLDLGGVSFIDSGGLGLLVRFLSRARRTHGDLKLSSIPARVGEILKITRLDTTFDSYATDADGVAAFYQRAKALRTSDRLETDVLCVATSPDVLAYVCGVLRQAGYGVMPSGNLPDAVVLLRASPPRLVIVGADLRSEQSTRTAALFHDLVEKIPVIELSADFALREAGDAGQRLLEDVRTVVGDRKTDTVDRRTNAG